MSTTPIVPKPAVACKHLHTKRPHNDHTLFCEDCKKDITDTQDKPVVKAAAAPIPVTGTTSTTVPPKDAV